MSATSGNAAQTGRQTIMTRTYRIAVIGCGDIAQTGHVPAVVEHDRFELVAACDVKPQRAKLLAKQGDAEACEDYRLLLGRDDIDAVIVALHPQDSVNIAIEFLRHGKPVLDEKPMAVDTEQGRRLVDVVDQDQGLYQVGFVFRYCDMVRYISRVAKLIGTPALYQVDIFDEKINRDDVTHFQRMQQILSHSSVVNHEGSHVFDYARLWNHSPFTQAMATAVRTEGDLAGPNIWSAMITMQDGSALQLNLGWLVPHVPASTVSITGPNGSLSVDLFAGTGHFEYAGNRETLSVTPLEQAWQRQLDVFAKAIDRGKATEATVYDGWTAMVAARACEQAQAKASVVSLATMGLI